MTLTQEDLPILYTWASHLVKWKIEDFNTYHRTGEKKDKNPKIGIMKHSKQTEKF